MDIYSFLNPLDSESEVFKKYDDSKEYHIAPMSGKQLNLLTAIYYNHVRRYYESLLRAKKDQERYEKILQEKEKGMVISKRDQTFLKKYDHFSMNLECELFFHPINESTRVIKLQDLIPEKKINDISC